MFVSPVEFLIGSAQRYPETVAVFDGSTSYTYSQLAALGAEICSELMATVGSGGPVVVYLPKCSDAVAAFAGILASGNFYVPMDLEAPVERQRAVFSQIGATGIVTYQRYTAVLQDILNVLPPLINVDELTTDPPTELCKPTITDQSPCYVMFTSGSTGSPKGVVVSNRGVIDYICWADEYFVFGQNAKIANQAPFFFDNSTLDIYLSWKKGCTCRLITKDVLFAFPRLVDLLATERVTFFFAVPSVFVAISNLRLLENRTLALEFGVFAGEVMPPRHIAYWQKRLPDTKFYNLYGPTEITVDCTEYYLAESAEDLLDIPLGYPRRNMEILLLDEEGRPVSDGSVGEMFVRGSAVALGYINNPAETKLRFVQNPCNPNWPETVYRTGDLAYRDKAGRLRFMGRTDSQIKLKGYRIELAELEYVVATVDGVNQCCAFLDSAIEGIVLAYSSNEDITSLVRHRLGERLPNYMIPTRIIRVDSLDLLENGKLDRVGISSRYGHPSLSRSTRQ